MEETLNLMLKDNVIDKKALLMRKHSLIGMTKDQALLIMNVVSLEEAGDKVTPNKIQKTFSYTKAELEHLMAELMEQGLVKIKMSKTGVEFKLNDL
jgi:predicted RNA-binding protein (virulence factor B family)